MSERIDKGWTIITESGLQLWTDGIFDEAEARAFVAANPTTGGGSRQYAVPNHIAHEADAVRARIQAESASVVRKACREAVAKLFEKQW